MHPIWTIRGLSSGLWLMAICWLQMLRHSCHANKPTTPFIKDIFIGRCWDYQTHINKEPFIHRKRNCTDLWDVFRNAFVYRTACDTRLDRYEAFTAAAWHSIPRDKSMFWSGVHTFIPEYTRSGKRFYAIGDTLIGYILNRIHWCAQTQSPGMNFEVCPVWGSCNHTAEWSFWKAASIAFAREAHGTAYVMFNGSSKSDPFRPNRTHQSSSSLVLCEGNRPVTGGSPHKSVFAEYELPHLHQERVSHLHVVLVKNLGTHFQTDCNHPSLVELRYVVESRKIEFTCVVNPPDILYLLCSHNPEADECRSLGAGDVYMSGSAQAVSCLITVTVSLLFIFQCWYYKS